MSDRRAEVGGAHYDASGAVAGCDDASSGQGYVMDRPAWAPDGVDMQQPSPARMYDALLGGSHNFAVDRGSSRSIPGGG